MLEIPKGDIEVNIRGKVQMVDLLCARCSAQAVEKIHGLKEGDQPKPRFLVDLAEAYVTDEILEECTPTEAYHLWAGVGAAFVEVKKKQAAKPKSQPPTVSTPSDSTKKNGSHSKRTSRKSTQSSKSKGEISQG